MTEPIKNTEAVTPEQPEAQKTDVTVETKSTEPVKSEGTKQATAFYEMRKREKALKDQVAQLEESIKKVTPVIDQPVNPEDTTPTVTPVQAAVQTPAVTPEAEKVDLVKLTTQADDLMLADIEIQKDPGAVFEIMDLVEHDAYLARLNSADPYLARKMALEKWKETNNIADTTTVAQPIASSSNVNRGNSNVDTMLATLKTLKPGTKEYSECLAKIVNAQNNK